jgi:ubiquinone/menaquinone biosynthesis C-methylase UbiE
MERETERRRAEPRGRLGTMVAIPEYDGESYLDFIEGLRKFALQTMNPLAAARFRERVAAVGAEGIDNLRVAGDGLAVLGLRNRLLRSTQDLNWAAVVAAYDAIRPELEAELESAAARGPGRLELAADWKHPAYSQAVHFHRQPGGYHEDTLAGYIYHYGTKVFHLGANDRDELKVARAWEVPTPVDEPVDRVIDIGCSIGAMTVAFKQRWPQAEVYGLDSAAPLLRYAHARAVQLGVDVVFAQRLAEDLQFPDASVDVAYLGTVLHEVPFAVAEQAVREARRVLRPGGVLVIHDMRQAETPPEPWADYDRDFDTRFNGEPFAYDFVRAGIGPLIERLFPSVSFSAARTASWECVG